MKSRTVFYQLFESQSSTYTYLLGDDVAKKAVLIDPVIETVDRDLNLVRELGLELDLILETHVHADHITGAGEIRNRTGAKVGIARVAGAETVDLPLEDGQEIKVGELVIKVIATPGHTNACLSYLCENRLFTGDALLIRGTGRTDFQQGSAETLYHSIHNRLFLLPEDTLVFPGHDYRGIPCTTIGLERRFNPRLGMGKSQADFVKTMSELKLANPKRIQEAVPANLRLGLTSGGKVFHPQIVNSIPEIQPDDVNLNLGRNFLLVDVRRPEEFNNELGHIPGAKLVTLGPDLMRFLEATDRNEEIVFICRSGGRSGQATALSLDFGYKHTMNLIGGMIRWNELGLPVARN